MFCAVVCLLQSCFSLGTAKWWSHLKWDMDCGFLPCDAMHKRSPCRHAVSVCHVRGFHQNEQSYPRTFFTIG